MSVLTRRDPLAQSEDNPARSLDASLFHRSDKSRAVKISLLRQDEKKGGERAWGVALKKSEAENLLDWLEANGRSGKLSVVPGEGFTVW